MRRAAAWLYRALPAIAAGLAAAIPVLTSTVHAVSAGWQPAGDDGIIATRGWDVLTSHSPLVGQYSEAGNVTSQIVHSPGPLLYWLLALPARFGSVSSLAVTMGIVNTLAIIACVALARRRGGLALMFATAVAIALMCQSLASESFHDIWNPAAALFPFLLLIFLCWSVACGDHKLLPLTVLDASFVTQTHLTYVAPTAAMLVIAAGGLLAGRLAERRRVAAKPAARRRPLPRGALAGDAALEVDSAPSRTREVYDALAEPRAPAGGQAPAVAAPEVDEAPGTGEQGRSKDAGDGGARPAAAGSTPIWRWVLAAVLVAAVCWAAPILDEIEHSPGNLTLIVRTTSDRGTTLGSNVGWTAVVRAVGWTPWWLYVPATEWSRKVDVRTTPTSAESDTTIAMLVALGVVALVGLLRRRRDLATAALIAFALCAALDANVAQTPVTPLLAATIGYTAWWASMLGMWLWLVLAWALWLWLPRLALASRRVRRARGRWSAPAAARSRRIACVLASLACLGLVVETGTAVAGTEKRDSHQSQYRPIGAIVARLDQVVPAHVALRFKLGPTNISTQPMEPAIRFGLVRHGDLVLSTGALARLGEYYELGNKHYSWYVYIADGAATIKHLVRVITVQFTDGFGHNTFSAYVALVGPRRRLRPPPGLRPSLPPGSSASGA
jgi:MYXO-CTERM domain-containing protein